jgi:hypothetical protein
LVCGGKWWCFSSFTQAEGDFLSDSTGIDSVLLSTLVERTWLSAVYLIYRFESLKLRCIDFLVPQIRAELSA